MNCVSGCSLWRYVDIRDRQCARVPVNTSTKWSWYTPHRRLRSVSLSLWNNFLCSLSFVCVIWWKFEKPSTHWGFLSDCLLPRASCGVLRFAVTAQWSALCVLSDLFCVNCVCAPPWWMTQCSRCMEASHLPAGPWHPACPRATWTSTTLSHRPLGRNTLASSIRVQWTHSVHFVINVKRDLIFDRSKMNVNVFVLCQLFL